MEMGAVAGKVVDASRADIVCFLDDWSIAPNTGDKESDIANLADVEGIRINLNRALCRYVVVDEDHMTPIIMEGIYHSGV